MMNMNMYLNEYVFYQIYIESLYQTEFLLPNFCRFSLSSFSLVSCNHKRVLSFINAQLFLEIVFITRRVRAASKLVA